MYDWPDLQENQFWTQTPGETVLYMQKVVRHCFAEIIWMKNSYFDFSIIH